MGSTIATPALPKARSGRSTAVLTAAALSVSAGGVHLVYAPDHWWLWWAYGLFFLGSGVLQVALGGLLLYRRPAPLVTLAAIAGNVGIVAVYAISRTPHGALIGPMRGHAELPGVVDMATTLGEVV